MTVNIWRQLNHLQIFIGECLSKCHSSCLEQMFAQRLKRVRQVASSAVARTCAQMCENAARCANRRTRLTCHNLLGGFASFRLQREPLVIQGKMLVLVQLHC